MLILKLITGDFPKQIHLKFINLEKVLENVTFHRVEIHETCTVRAMKPVKNLAYK